MEADALLAAYPLKTLATRKLKKSQQDSSWSHIKSLSVQGMSAFAIVEQIDKKDIALWSKVLENSSSTIYNSAHKALLQILPTASNLFRWKKVSDPNCPLCKQGLIQTNKHALSNCTPPVALQRFTGRHNGVLQMIIIWLKAVLSPTQKLFGDIENDQWESTSELFHTLRPDLAILDALSITILELTICHETNLNKLKSYKINKYKNIASYWTWKSSGKTISTYTLEVSTLGLISPCLDFTNAIGVPSMPTDLKERITRATLSSSFKIYCGRNSI